MTDPRIKALEPKPDHRIALIWEDGSTGTVDLSPEIKRGGVFARLADESQFRKVRLAPGGRAIEWPDESGEAVVDIDAEALRRRAHRDSLLTTVLRHLHLAPSG